MPLALDINAGRIGPKQHPPFFKCGFGRIQNAITLQKHPVASPCTIDRYFQRAQLECRGLDRSGRGLSGKLQRHGAENKRCQRLLELMRSSLLLYSAAHDSAIAPSLIGQHAIKCLHRQVVLGHDKLHLAAWNRAAGAFELKAAFYAGQDIAPGIAADHDLAAGVA